MHELLFPHFFALTTAQAVTHQVSNEWEWYIVRASGFVAAGLLFLLMVSGIGQVTGLTYRFMEPIRAWAFHKALAMALLVSIAIHGTFLFLDHYISFSIPRLLVPFLSHYSNGTAFLGISSIFGVAFGILAMYGIVITVTSSLEAVGWINSKKRTWKTLHLLNYVIFVFVFLHALLVGTDLRYGMFRQAWILLGSLVVIAIVSRLLRVGTTRRPSSSDA